MPFQEKSAWIMAILLLIVGAAYFSAVLGAWSETGKLGEPMLPLFIAYTICLVVLAVVAQVAIAIFSPKEANVAADERERRIFDRAGHYSSYFMGAGVVMSLGAYMFVRSGDLLFYTVFASLMVGQIMEYVFQIIFYRTTF
ncbi:MAG: hypothetical protein WBM76_09025 [Woeseiaceae bacterium]|jgi:hypothetical protein